MKKTRNFVHDKVFEVRMKYTDLGHRRRNDFQSGGAKFWKSKMARKRGGRRACATQGGV